MRLAYICADPGIPVFGRKGASVHVQEVVGALRRWGARAELFAADLGGDPLPGFEIVPIHRLPGPFGGDRAARERAALAANDVLRAALERAGPFDLVYERYSLWSFAGMAYARSIGAPGLLEVNAPLIEEQADYRGLVDRASAESLATRVFGDATALLAVSAEVAAYLERWPDVRGRVHIVPNGVDAERFTPGEAPALPSAPGIFTVGFTGTLKPWHGLLVLAEAFALLHAHEPATRLLVVGDGPERVSLEADLAARGLRHAVCLTGAVAPRAVPGLLASMDVAVAPYPPQQQFYFSPLKLYEYMAAGLPVVASRIGQLDDVIEHEVNGLLCPPGDARALAEALARLQQDPQMRARLGQAARAAVLRHHTWDVVGRCILGLAGAHPTRVQRGAGA